jgi:hypothetical protein
MIAIINGITGWIALIVALASPFAAWKASSAPKGITIFVGGLLIWWFCYSGKRESELLIEMHYNGDLEGIQRMRGHMIITMIIIHAITWPLLIAECKIFF